MSPRVGLARVVCEWWAGCTRSATGTLDHPILGPVPICDRCRARVLAIDEDRK